MGKVDRLRTKVEPFAALFWALGIVLANTRRCPRGPLLFSYLGMLFIYGLTGTDL